MIIDKPKHPFYWRKIAFDPPPSGTPMLFGQVTVQHQAQQGQPKTMFTIDIGYVEGGNLALMVGATPEPEYWCPLPDPPAGVVDPPPLVVVQ